MSAIPTVTVYMDDGSRYVINKSDYVEGVHSLSAPKPKDQPKPKPKKRKVRK